MVMFNLSSLLKRYWAAMYYHLFHTASCESHCVHHLLTVAKSTKYALRLQ